MVFVQKTYSRARGLWSKMLTVTLIVVGFFAILFNTRSSIPGLDATLDQTSVAHADAVSGFSCGDFSCSQGSDTDCGGGAGGSAAVGDADADADADGGDCGDAGDDGV